MTDVDPGTAVVLLILGACAGVELSRVVIDWNHDNRTGGSMRHLAFLVTIITLAALFAACDPAEPRGCADERERVFADVPADHPLCEEIESLYRDGLTNGCASEVTSIRAVCVDDTDSGECHTEEVVTRYFCPDDSLTRGMAAMFVEHRDPFAQLDRDGRIHIGDHVVTAERFTKGHYWIQFRRDIQRCSMEGWSHDYSGPNVEVDVDRLSPTIDTVEVFTTIHGVPRDMWFNVRIHCR